MELLPFYNDQSKMVIVLTHDQGIAEQSGRNVEISDGKIV